MTPSPITIEDIKTSLRLDLPDDDTMIQRYINTAESYVANAVNSNVDIVVYREDDRFNTAVALLTEFLYMSRGITDTSAPQRPFEITGLINQMRGDQAYA